MSGMEDDKAKQFRIVLANTTLEHFHGMTLSWWAFQCRIMDRPTNPYHRTYIYNKRDVETPGPENLLAVVIADQPTNTQVLLHIIVARDEFIEPFSKWLQASYDIRLTPQTGELAAQQMVSEPEAWLAKLQETGLVVGSKEWWSTIEKWTRDYWAQKGKPALPIKGRLEKCTGFSRQHIYRNTSLGNKKSVT